MCSNGYTGPYCESKVSWLFVLYLEHLHYLATCVYRSSLLKVGVRAKQCFGWTIAHSLNLICFVTSVQGQLDNSRMRFTFSFLN